MEGFSIRELPKLIVYLLVVFVAGSIETLGMMSELPMVRCLNKTTMERHLTGHLDLYGAPYMF